jgi:predicted nuclease with TOPRIM domain
MDSIYTVVITAITVLGGSTAFRYYERRAMHRERDEDFIRHDCRDRISKLEALLVEKDKMRELILRLTSEVAELRMKVEFLTDENEKLNKEKKKLNG